MSGSELEAALGLPLLAEFDRATLEHLLMGSKWIVAPAGTLLFREGESAEYLYVLVSGIVELTRVEGDDYCGVLMLTKGDVFMPAAAIFAQPYLVSGLVLCSSRVLLLRADVVRKEAASNATMAMWLCRMLAGQWRMAVRHILDLKCRSAPQRLGAFLLRIVEEGDDLKSAELPISRRHLAARLGMKAETLSRALQVIARNGLQLRGKRVVVKDRQMIEAFCGPDPYPERTESLLGVHAL